MKLKQRRLEPRLRVWKFKNDKTLQEFADPMYAVVEGKGQECSESDINDRREFMNGTMISDVENVSESMMD